MRTGIWALSAGLFMTVCSRAPSGGAPASVSSAPFVQPSQSATVAQHTESVVEHASEPDIEPEPDWAALIRNGRYKAALLKLQAAPDAQRSSPEARLAEGLLDFKLADIPAAETALRGVEAQLPALKQAIAMARAQALKAAAASVDESTLGNAALDKAGCLKRAQHYADEGQLARAQAELQLMQSAPGAPPSQLAVTLVQAWAQYNARADYAKAAELFTQAAQLDHAQTPKYLFYAARALSRDNRNQEAIARYRDLLKRFPKTSEAEEARYLIARLHYAQSEWPQAEQAYSDYLQLYGKKGNRRGRFTGVATYERAVTRLAAGKSAVAAADFTALLKGSTDVYEQAQLLELLGASYSVSNPAQAVRPLQQAIETWPLSLPAALAALRLGALHAALPSFPSDSSSALPALTIQLPTDVQMLQHLGFEDLAASGLAAHERAFAGSYGSRGNEAMCQAYAMLDDARERYRYGRAKVRPAALLSPPKQSNRWAWDCLYPRPHREAVAQAEQRFQVSSNLIYAVMRRESAFRVDAVSDAGAQGLMQLMPTTADKISAQLDASGERIDSSEFNTPLYNIQLGAKYLRLLSDDFAHQGPLILAAYNAGPAAVSRWLEHGETLPLDVWIARIPYAETRRYVIQVITNWIRYATLVGAPLPELQLSIPTGLRAASESF